MAATVANVSVVVGCANRTPYLLQALPSWLACPEVAEVVVVDWGSTPPVAEALAGVGDPRVRVLRVSDIDRWVLSLALNFGARAARAPLLLKADADTVLRPGFFAAHPLAATDSAFYRGNWEAARDENERHLNGVVFLPRAAFQAANGYNEWLRSYGWDDTDLYLRLQAAGLAQRDLDPDFLEHLPHSDRLRSGAADPGLLTLTNKYLAQICPWSAAMWPTAFTLLGAPPPQPAGTGAPALQAEGEWAPANPGQYEPPGLLVDSCRVSAWRDALAQVGYDWSLTAGRQDAVVQRLYHRRAAPRFVLEALNGLGNRLRALASAAILAEADGRPFVLVWRLDDHCGAAFEDLFDASGLLCTATWAVPADVAALARRDSISLPGFEIVGADSVTFGPTHGALVLPAAEEVYVASACALVGPATNWQKEAQWLRALSLRPALARSVGGYARWMSNAALQVAGLWTMPDLIGLHLRMGQPPGSHPYEDMSGWDPAHRAAGERARAQSHYSGFMAELDRAWADEPAQRFFLCADTPEAYAAFEARYPDRVNSTLFWTPKRAWDRSAAQLKSAVVDVYLLAGCSALWLSPWSSFSELALRLSQPGTPARYAGTDFGAPAAPSPPEEPAGSPAEDV